MFWVWQITAVVTLISATWYSLVLLLQYIVFNALYHYEGFRWIMWPKIIYQELNTIWILDLTWNISNNIYTRLTVMISSGYTIALVKESHTQRRVWGMVTGTKGLQITTTGEQIKWHLLHRRMTRGQYYEGRKPNLIKRPQKRTSYLQSPLVAGLRNTRNISLPSARIFVHNGLYVPHHGIDTNRIRILT